MTYVHPLPLDVNKVDPIRLNEFLTLLRVPVTFQVLNLLKLDSSDGVKIRTHVFHLSSPQPQFQSSGCFGTWSIEFLFEMRRQRSFTTHGLGEQYN